MLDLAGGGRLDVHGLHPAFGRHQPRPLHRRHAPHHLPKHYDLQARKDAHPRRLGAQGIHGIREVVLKGSG